MANLTHKTRDSLAEDISRTLDSILSPSVFLRTTDEPTTADNLQPNKHPLNPIIADEENSLKSVELSQSPSFSRSYLEEWERLFSLSGEALKNHLKTSALEGNLRNSRFRSVCWRVCLAVLSTDPTAWERETNRSRDLYSSIKNTFSTNFEGDGCDKLADSVDLGDDPLSLNENSRWNQHFKIMEIRREIMQDVVRTFPELQFFHDNTIRQSMVNVLLCYSLTSSLRYKQGMHEILAPLLFVLHCDQMAFEHASEVTNLPEKIVQPVICLLDKRYLEHDSFALFSAIMTYLGPWYYVDGDDSTLLLTETKCINHQKRDSLVKQSMSSKCPVIDKLYWINEHILKSHCREVYTHLQNLEISPQMYGLRWMRLLFGREFPLQDLLVVWDAIFGMQDDMQLVDYIFVAMLWNIRVLLLRSDFSECLCFLMRYPHVVDVHFLASMALHMLDSYTYPKPPIHGNLYPHHIVAADKSKRRKRGERNKTISVGLESITSRFLKSEVLPRFTSFSPFGADISPSVTPSSPEDEMKSPTRTSLPRRSLSLLESNHSPVPPANSSNPCEDASSRSSLHSNKSSLMKRRTARNPASDSNIFKDFIEIRLPHEVTKDDHDGTILQYYHELCHRCSRILDSCVQQFVTLLPQDMKAVQLTSSQIQELFQTVETVKEISKTLRNSSEDELPTLPNSYSADSLRSAAVVSSRNKVTPTLQEYRDKGVTDVITEDASEDTFISPTGPIFASRSIELSVLGSPANHS